MTASIPAPPAATTSPTCSSGSWPPACAHRRDGTDRTTAEALRLADAQLAPRPDTITGHRRAMTTGPLLESRASPKSRREAHRPDSG